MTHVPSRPLASALSAALFAASLVACSGASEGAQAPALPVHVVFLAARQQPPRLRAFIDAMKAALPQLHGMRPAPR